MCFLLGCWCAESSFDSDGSGAVGRGRAGDGGWKSPLEQQLRALGPQPRCFDRLLWRHAAAKTAIKKQPCHGGSTVDTDEGK